ncbi:hypothetical protein ACRAWF_28295 [Streptomyces sp. L7]
MSVKTGDTPSGQIGTVTSSDVVVQAAVPGTDAQLLRHGMTAQLTTADGKSATGTVDVVADGADPSSGTDSSATAPATTGESDSSDSSGSTAAVQVRITVPEPGPLAGEAGAAVKVTVKVGASDGKVLTGADGRDPHLVRRAGPGPGGARRHRDRRPCHRRALRRRDRRSRSPPGAR